MDRREITAKWISIVLLPMRNLRLREFKLPSLYRLHYNGDNEDNKEKEPGAAKENYFEGNKNSCHKYKLQFIFSCTENVFSYIFHFKYECLIRSNTAFSKLIISEL